MEHNGNQLVFLCKQCGTAMLNDAILNEWAADYEDDVWLIEVCNQCFGSFENNYQLEASLTGDLLLDNY